MAIYFGRFDILKRVNPKTKRVQSAVGASAYKACEKLRHFEASAAAAYITGSLLESRGKGKIHDYSKKQGVVYSEILRPDHAPDNFADRQTLWNAVELAEKRKDSQLAREFIGALPLELDHEEQIDLVREYAMTNFVEHGMIADYAIHHPDYGENNPHVHIMLTMRDVTKAGFGNKNRDWNQPQMLEDWRKGWADVQNKYLELAGYDIQEIGVDHRSYKEQGSGLIGQYHEGKDATQLRRQGVLTEIAKLNEEIKAHNMAYTIEVEKQVKEATADLTGRLEEMEAQLLRLQPEIQPIQAVDLPQFVPSGQSTVLYDVNMNLQPEIQFEQQIPQEETQSMGLADLEIQNQIISLQRFRQEMRSGELAKQERIYKGRISTIQKRFDNFQRIDDEIKAEKEKTGSFSLRGFLGVDDPVQYLRDSQDGAREGFLNTFGIEPQADLVGARVAEYEEMLTGIEQERREMPDVGIYKQQRDRVVEQAKIAYAAGERFDLSEKGIELPSEYQELTMAEEMELNRAREEFRAEVVPQQSQERGKERSKSQDRGQSLG